MNRIKKMGPLAGLRIIEMAGHAISEPGIRPAMMQAIEDIAIQK